MPRVYLFIAALVLVLPGIGVRDIQTSHEGRVAQTARRMAVSGWPWDATPVTVSAVSWQSTPAGRRLIADPSLPPLQVNPWLVPVMNGELRLQKPPLPYWVTAVGFRLIAIKPWVARLAPALMWAVLVLIVADLAGRLLGRRWAVWAGLIWLSTFYCLEEFRKSMADPYLAFFTIAAVWAWLRATGERRNHFILLFYVLVGLGFLAKGPAVFIGAITGVVALAISRRQFARGLWGHLAGLLILVLLSIPWYAAVWHKVPNAIELWRYESVGGFGEKQEKPQPIWYYVPQVLGMALPWTPLWIAGIAGSLKRRRMMPLLWQGLFVVIFSVITQKKLAYLMPVLAAQTLLTTQGLRFLFARLRTRERRQLWQRRLAWIGGAVAVAIAVGLALGDRKDNRRSPRQLAEAVTPMLAGTTASFEESMLSPDAAFYLPLDLPVDRTNPLKWVILNVGRKGEDAARGDLQLRFRGSLQTASLVTIPNGPKSSDWALYEVRLNGPVSNVPP